MNGELHVAKVAPSTRHWNADADVPLNEKAGVASLVGPLGPAVIVVSGLATVKARLATGAEENRLSRTENV